MSMQSANRRNLRHLRNQAKQFLKAFRSSNSEIFARILSLHPKWEGCYESELMGRELTLHDAQLVIARRIGFASWPNLVVGVAVASEQQSLASNASLAGHDLSGTDLEGLLLDGATLTGLRLKDANLKNANLRNADLPGCSFQGADLEDMEFEGVRIAGANMKGLKLRDGGLSDLPEVAG